AARDEIDRGESPSACQRRWPAVRLRHDRKYQPKSAKLSTRMAHRFPPPRHGGIRGKRVSGRDERAPHTKVRANRPGDVTMVFVPDSDHPDFSERTIITERKAVPAGVPTERAAYLVVIYGADLGKRIPLGPGAVEAGRSTKCDISIDQESVSRRHA